MKTTVEMSSDNTNVVRRVQYVWIVGEDYVEGTSWSSFAVNESEGRLILSHSKACEPQNDNNIDVVPPSKRHICVKFVESHQTTT